MMTFHDKISPQVLIISLTWYTIVYVQSIMMTFHDKISPQVLIISLTWYTIVYVQSIMMTFHDKISPQLMKLYFHIVDLAEWTRRFVVMLSKLVHYKLQND